MRVYEKQIIDIHKTRRAFMFTVYLLFAEKVSKSD